MEQPFGITVVFGIPPPDAGSGGYDAIDPILEILVDIGLIADARQARWQRQITDPKAGDPYRVTIETRE